MRHGLAICMVEACVFGGAIVFCGMDSSEHEYDEENGEEDEN